MQNGQCLLSNSLKFSVQTAELLEWDGILMYRHEKSQKGVLVVIETKQIVTMEKFEIFKTRFLEMKMAMKNTVVDDDLWPFRDFFAKQLSPVTSFSPPRNLVPVPYIL